MTFQDQRLGGPIEPPEPPSPNRQDVVPVSERNQDPMRSTNELVTEAERPLTDAERKAADQDTGISERVYAPASERVPRTVEGYRDVIEHPDNGTPERQAIAQSSTSPAMTSDAEPSFTRVARPNNGPTGYMGTDPAGYNGNGMGHGGENDWSQQSNRWMSNMSSSSAVPFGVGWLTLGLIGGIGVWLWMRWQRERNKPINRLRRQADQARKRAYALRDQMPDVPEEAVRPAMGLGTALVSLAIFMWQQSQSRSRQEELRSQMNSRSRNARKQADKASRQATKAGKKAVDAVSDMDWMERLAMLREMWSERAPISR
jgi:hypothetical protein